MHILTITEYAKIAQHMSKVWKILPQKSADLIEQLLINRGLKNKKEIEDFFSGLESRDIIQGDLVGPFLKAKIRLQELLQTVKKWQDWKSSGADQG